MRPLLTTLCLATLCLASMIVQAEIVRLETYMPAQQVDQFFSTDEGLEKALLKFKSIGIQKIYLESLRSGYTAKLDTLRDAKRFFESNGIEVSGGITTTYGNNFGVQSNLTRLWLNFQNPKTQNDLRSHIEEIAPIFEEIIIDDFFASDDESDESIKAKGDNSWADYRMNLMSQRITQDVVLIPSRKLNPDLKWMIKYPQWYDRFHRFGYDVINEPPQFNRVWVGTETRRHDTKRYGYVMPSMGYVNYRWLSSLKNGTMGGAWYDFGDCAEGVYRMQAYQSVLAGAREIVLFEAASILNGNECINGLLPRRDALIKLGELIDPYQPKGILAFKPPHSEGSDPNGAANLYVMDYLVTLGLPILPTASLSTSESHLFLPRQAAGQSFSLREILKERKIVIATPDFLMASKDKTLIQAFGYEPFSTLDTEEISAKSFILGRGKSIETSKEVFVRPIPSPTDASILLAAKSGDKTIPMLTKKTRESTSFYVLNIKTFAHEEFGPDREMFLPPRPLTIQNWPNEVVAIIQEELSKSLGVPFTVPNNVGVYLFANEAGEQLLVLANFNEESVSIQTPANTSWDIHPEWLCATGTSKTIHPKLIIPAWEIVILSRN